MLNLKVLPDVAIKTDKIAHESKRNYSVYRLDVSHANEATPVM